MANPGCSTCSGLTNLVRLTKIGARTSVGAIVDFFDSKGTNFKSTVLSQFSSLTAHFYRGVEHLALNCVRSKSHRIIEGKLRPSSLGIVAHFERNSSGSVQRLPRQVLGVQILVSVDVGGTRFSGDA